MRVLLINPNSILIEKSWAYKKFFTPIAPLGLAYIAGSLRSKGITVRIFDQFADKTTDQQLIGSIKDFKPEIIGFGALTSVMPDIKRIIAGIRDSGIQSRIVLGNIHATCFPDKILNEGLADIVVRGEGETTMLELCDSLKNNLDLAKVKGLSFKFNGRAFHSLDRDPIPCLDDLPLPAWDMLDLDKYAEVPLAAITKSRALPIVASRGCDYNCYYCSQDKIYPKVRYRKLEKVVDEMEEFNSKHNIKFFGFSDAYFPHNEESGLFFCELLIKRNLHKKVKWATETRVDKVTPRLLKAMKASGAHLVMYGVEVGNPGILKSLNKGTTLEQARSAFSQTRKAGILSQGLFILGLPHETADTCRETINFAKTLDCDIVKFNIAMPYPGSRFFEEFSKTNRVDDYGKFTSWYDWTNSKADLIYVPEGMDSRMIRSLQRKAMFDFYMRPAIMFKYVFKGTAPFKNIIFGGVWLISLLLRSIIDKIKAVFKK